VPNVVNLAKKSPATHLLVVHHYDRVGVLSAVFSQLKHAGINIQETENNSNVSPAKATIGKYGETRTIKIRRSPR
jgi:hypothetical protein